MTYLSDIIRFVENTAGHRLNRDEGVQHGRNDRLIRGATVAWMASPDAIRAAGAAGHDLLIGHESLYFPYDVVVADNPPPGWREWQINRQRFNLLEKYRLSFLRLHGSVDQISIFDTFAELLGLGEPVYANGLVKVYEIAPCPLAELVERVKHSVGMPHLRVAAQESEASEGRTVHRVGLPWGGLGLFVNVGYQQQLIEQRCDVFIAGESDNYGFRFAAECGIPMIETSHEVSENPGLRRFVALLSETFPGVEFKFFENECVWKTY
jgi:putative NIF3 family GTP cyclohydrolase 1 type 2